MLSATTARKGSWCRGGISSHETQRLAPGRAKSQEPRVRTVLVDVPAALWECWDHGVDSKAGAPSASATNPKTAGRLTHAPAGTNPTTGHATVYFFNPDGQVRASRSLLGGCRTPWFSPSHGFSCWSLAVSPCGCGCVPCGLRGACTSLFCHPLPPLRCFFRWHGLLLLLSHGGGYFC